MARINQLVLPTGADASVIYQDGRWRTSGELKEEVKRLSERLVAYNCARALLKTRRADNVIIALLACKKNGCDLILHRATNQFEDIAESLGADVLLDDSLMPVITGVQAKQVSKHPCVILLTSGTTGRPKAASHSLQSLLGTVPELCPKKQPRWMLTYDPASFAGLQVILTSLVGGAQLGASSEPTIEAITKLSLSLRPTAISGTPTFWRAFISAIDFKTYDAPLRHATVGGEAVDQMTLDRIAHYFPFAKIKHIYASTEAGAAFSVKDGYAGFPSVWLETGVDGVHLRVIDSVLQIKSVRLSKGYLAGLKMPIECGWLDTGDIVEVIGARVFFRGRRDNIINVGGSKVRPEEIEAIILAVPTVVDAYVKGIKNPITGELVAADIVVQPGVESSSAIASVEQATKALPPFARPRIVRVVSQIARNAVGKKLRSK